MPFLWIALGGGAGSVCRYLVWRALTPTDSAFPIGTFAVNILGCFAIGVLGSRLTGETERLALMTGFVGGFTTFSAFGLETLNLIRNGSASVAAAYVACSNAGGLVAAWAGWRLASSLQ